jgi:hypothetical protein
MFVFDESNDHNVSSAHDISQSTHVQRVVHIINNVLGDEVAMLEISRDFAVTFGRELDDANIISAIRRVSSVGYSFAVEPSSEFKFAFVKGIPNKMKNDSDNTPHLICFNDTFLSIGSGASAEARDRCVFFHVAKTLCEIVQSFALAFVRAATARKNAGMAGTTAEVSLVMPVQHLSDLGASLEQRVFGGRLAVQSQRQPFSRPLTLLAADNACEAHRAPMNRTANVWLVEVSDAVLGCVLAQLEGWLPGTPLPDLRLWQSAVAAASEDDQMSGGKRSRDNTGAEDRSGSKMAYTAADLQETGAVQDTADEPVDEE